MNIVPLPSYMQTLLLNYPAARLVGDAAHDNETVGEFTARVQGALKLSQKALRDHLRETPGTRHLIELLCQQIGVELHGLTMQDGVPAVKTNLRRSSGWGPLQPHSTHEAKETETVSPLKTVDQDPPTDTPSLPAGLGSNNPFKAATRLFQKRMADVEASLPGVEMTEPAEEEEEISELSSVFEQVSLTTGVWSEDGEEDASEESSFEYAVTSDLPEEF